MSLLLPIEFRYASPPTLYTGCLSRGAFLRHLVNCFGVLFFLRRTRNQARNRGKERESGSKKRRRKKCRNAVSCQATPCWRKRASERGKSEGRWDGEKWQRKIAREPEQAGSTHRYIKGATDGATSYGRSAFLTQQTVYWCLTGVLETYTFKITTT